MGEAPPFFFGFAVVAAKSAVRGFRPRRKPRPLPCVSAPPCGPCRMGATLRAAPGVRKRRFFCPLLALLSRRGEAVLIALLWKTASACVGAGPASHRPSIETPREKRFECRGCKPDLPLSYHPLPLLSHEGAGANGPPKAAAPTLFFQQLCRGGSPGSPIPKFPTM